LYYQTLSKEYVTFLRDANVTNNSGQELYNLWEMFGKSEPELMNSKEIMIDKPPVIYQITAVANNPGMGSATGGGDYEHGQQVTLTAMPATGYHFVKWTENGTQVSDQAEYTFTATANRSLVAHFDVSGIPDDRIVSGESIPSGTEACYDALKTITVSDLTVETNAALRLVAGESIHLLPGITIMEGAYFHAHITLTGSFCAPLAKSEVNLEIEEVLTTVPTPELTSGSSFFKVYPNPTEGIFTLEIEGDDGITGIYVEICSIRGSRVISSAFPAETHYELNLAGHQPGIYVIRVMKGNLAGTARIIKR